ncbi:MAG: FkbM family methyltransferase [Kiritimatiellales bacterium]|jgi:FkbM family methyltransferase
MNILKKIKKWIYRDYFSDRPRIYNRFGALWLLRYRNHIDRKLILGELYEAGQLEYCGSLVKERDITGFIDVGANIGLYSVLLTKSYPQLTRVISFEPDVRNYNNFCANLNLNNLDSKVDARMLGISSAKTEVSFLSNLGNSTGTSRIAATAPERTRLEKFAHTKIRVDTLDTQLSGVHDETLFFKVDVEGHETEVIHGAGEVFKNNRCLIQMEILGKPDAVIQLLNECGFSQMKQIKGDFYFSNF